jgi:hypothetical protein
MFLPCPPQYQFAPFRPSKRYKVSDKQYELVDRLMDRMALPIQTIDKETGEEYVHVRERNCVLLFDVQHACPTCAFRLHVELSVPSWIKTNKRRWIPLAALYGWLVGLAHCKQTQLPTAGASHGTRISPKTCTTHTSNTCTTRFTSVPWTKSVRGDQLPSFVEVYSPAAKRLAAKLFFWS